jgi:cob(I)alamin adenosyltransferase
VADKPYLEPKLELNKIYTKMGDAGETRLVGGTAVPKNHPRLDCYGTVDELNSFVGMAALTANGLSAREPRLQPLAKSLLRVQHELFNLGSILATPPEDVGPRQPRVTDADVAELEREMDSLNSELPALSSFVLPGGSRLNVELHACRTICRRAERLLVGLSHTEEAAPEALRYLNRLSDAFFVWSRWVNKLLGVEETLWSPNQAASGR